MIFCISKRGVEHPDFGYRIKHNELVIDSTEQLSSFNKWGYHLPDRLAGTWWSLNLTDSSIVIERAITSTHHFGTKDDNVIISNHPSFIDHLINNDFTKAAITKGVLQIDRHTPSFVPGSKTFEEVINEVRQIVIRNIQHLVDEFGCDAVPITAGIDSSTVYHLSPVPLTPYKCSRLSDDEFPHMESSKFSFPDVIHSGSHSLVNPVASFYDIPGLITGHCGDQAFCRRPAIQYHLLEKYKHLYDEQNGTFDGAMVHLDKRKNAFPIKGDNLRMEFYGQFVHGGEMLVFGDKQFVFTPFADTRIPELILCLSDDDLVFQCITGHIQKEILKGSGLKIHKKKNIFGEFITL